MPEEGTKEYILPAVITTEGVILVPNANSIITAPDAVKLVLPYHFALLKNKYQEGIIQQKGYYEEGEPLDRLPHTELINAGITTRRDEQVYGRSIPLGAELQKLGWTQRDLVALEELASHMQMVSIFNLEFPGFEQPNSPYQTEYSERYLYGSTINALQNYLKIHPSKHLDLLEIGGQEGKLSREIISKLGSKVEVSVDIVDKFVTGRLKTDNPNIQLKKVPGIRIIQADAMNLKRVNESLSKSGSKGLKKYDACMMYFVAGIAHNPVELLNSAWDAVKDGGDILIENIHNIWFFTSGDNMTRENKQAAKFLLKKLRSVDSVERFSDEDWGIIAGKYRQLMGMAGSPTVTLERYLSSRGISFEVVTDNRGDALTRILVIHKSGKINPFSDLEVSRIGTYEYHLDKGAYLIKLRHTVPSPHAN